MAPTAFNNVIIGQFVLSGVPIKVYASGRFLTVTDADDVEDPAIGFGMDENGAMIQFSYPEVEFLSVQGNKVDIETYNKGMAKLHGGDEAPAEKEPEADKEEDEGEEAKEGPSMSDHYNPKENINMKLKDLIKESFLGVLPSKRNMIKMKHNPLSEISQDEVDAEVEGAEAQIDAAKAKLKAAQASMKDTMKSSKEKIKAASAQPIDDGIVDTGMSVGQKYTFGKGDIVNNTNPGCVHYGSKGIVIDIPSAGEVRYSVTNGDASKTYRPGDILTKTDDQLEKI